MQIYLNQDYQRPTLETEARPLMTTSTLGDTLEGFIQRYTDDQVAVSLQDLKLGNITFISGKEGKLVSSVVQAEATVRYSHASSDSLWSRNTKLDTDYRAAFQVQLMNDEDGWRVWVITESQAGA